MRDVGLDAPIEYLREYLDDSEQRQFTGLKYFRTSRDNDESEPYDEELANKALEEHSMHFVSSRGAQLAALEANGLANPMIVCAFDADLFGHWWYEGTSFLERIFRKAAERGDFIFTNPSSYLTDSHEQTLPTVSPVSSSWGEGGYFETWTSESNNWVHSEIQKRAEQLARFVYLFRENRDDFTAEAIIHRQRCIQLLTKELLLAQSSDWAFLMNNEPSREYAEKRTRDHFANFDRIWVLTTKSSDDGEFDEIDPLNPIYSDLPWNLFEPCG
jgi:1,4-alpha-glucan branching enzyme